MQSAKPSRRSSDVHSTDDAGLRLVLLVLTVLAVVVALTA